MNYGQIGAFAGKLSLWPIKLKQFKINPWCCTRYYFATTIQCTCVKQCEVFLYSSPLGNLGGCGYLATLTSLLFFVSAQWDSVVRI